MRFVPAELTARLVSGVTTLAYVWRILRRDGAAFAFTDHDNPLPFDGLIAEPLTGLSGGAIEKGLDLAVDTASIAGVMSSTSLNEADLARGLWDGASVDVYRVDWSEPGLRVHLFIGHTGEVRRGENAFEAELRGLQTALNVSVGRVFSRFCDADPGDARCGKPLANGVYRGEGAITDVLSATSFRASGLGAFASDWFARGRIEWADGGASEVSEHRLEGADAVIDVIDASPVIAAGAPFIVYAGCDKRFETCRTKFANTLNFRGFPHMPGNDAVQSGPVVGSRLDGSSRFT